MPGSERWRRRITEKAYRLRVLGPPISPQDTVDWKEEEYRLLRFVRIRPTGDLLVGGAETL